MTGQIRVGACWRPWGIDTLATVRRLTPGGATIAYDHAPEVEHTLQTRELASWGRFVARSDFARTKRHAVIAAMQAEEEADEAA